MSERVGVGETEAGAGLRPTLRPQFPHSGARGGGGGGGAWDLLSYPKRWPRAGSSR